MESDLQDSAMLLIQYIGSATTDAWIGYLAFKTLLCSSWRSERMVDFISVVIGSNNLDHLNGTDNPSNGSVQQKNTALPLNGDITSTRQKNGS